MIFTKEQKLDYLFQMLAKARQQKMFNLAKAITESISKLVKEGQR